MIRRRQVFQAGVEQRRISVNIRSAAGFVHRSRAGQKSVDTKTDALIRRAFREEIPDTTKIIIAQRISSVMDADQIIVMDNGLINGRGTHEELLASNEIYREVYESQQKGGLEE